MESYGSTNRNAMENWGKKADELLKNLQVDNLGLRNQITVEIKKPSEILTSEGNTKNETEKN
jgi:hypothetical protein